MRPDGGDEGRRDARVRLLPRGADEERARDRDAETDVVFDFTGLHRPDVRDLGLILTARLQSAPEDRVWVRALPYQTWSLLRALGVDHMFRIYPHAAERMD